MALCWLNHSCAPVPSWIICCQLAEVTPAPDMHKIAPLSSGWSPPRLQSPGKFANPRWLWEHKSKAQCFALQNALATEVGLKCRSSNPSRKCLFLPFNETKLISILSTWFCLATNFIPSKLELSPPVTFCRAPFETSWESPFIENPQSFTQLWTDTVGGLLG